MRPRGLGAVLGCLLLLQRAWALPEDGVEEERLSVIDVPAVVCPTGPGTLRIPLEVNGSRRNGNGQNARDTPHVLTFFRTFKEGVALNFTLWAGTKKVIGPEVLTLHEFSADLPASEERRLDEEPVTLQDDGPNCEEFFLLDGRDPVALPDTWQEAKDAFNDLCTEEGGDNCTAVADAVFPGPPGATFAPDREVCDRLVGLALGWAGHDGGVLLMSRRLKGGGSYSTRGGGRSHSAHTNSRNPTAGTYGYSSTRFGRAYPTGAATTSYGFAGRGPLRGRVGGTAMVFFWYSPGFRHSRAYTHCHDGSKQECGASSESCQVGAPCDWSVSVDGLYRDDLMSLGFIPNMFDAHVRKPSPDVYEFELELTGIASHALNESGVCPPASWNVGGDAVAGAWTPASAQQDLFVALSAMEGMEWEEDGDATVAIVLAIIGSLVACGLVAMICTCVCGGSGGSTEGRDDPKLRSEFFAMTVERSGMEGSNRDQIIPEVFELSHAFDNYKHRWIVAADGTFTGTLATPQSAADPAVRVFGVLCAPRDGSGDGVRWRESLDAGSSDAAWERECGTGAIARECVGRLCRSDPAADGFVGFKVVVTATIAQLRGPMSAVQYRKNAMLSSFVLEAPIKVAALPNLAGPVSAGPIVLGTAIKADDLPAVLPGQLVNRAAT